MMSTADLRRTWAGHTTVEALCDAIEVTVRERDEARARVAELEALVRRVVDRIQADPHSLGYVARLDMTLGCDLVDAVATP